MPRDTIRLAEENNVDLARLPWEPTEARVFSTDLLRIALRFGSTCSDGLVVPATEVVTLGRSDELRLLNRQSTEAHVALRDQNNLMESLIPGWKAQGEALDRQIAESMELTAQEADAEVAEQFAAPVNVDLRNHWVALGGTLPDPL